MSKNLAEDLQRTARHALAGLQPAPMGEEPGGLSFRRLIAAAFRARWLVFATTLAGAMVGTFLAITTANSYVSVGKFLFTSSGAESTTFDPTRMTPTSQETIATGASYILSSEELLRQVVDKVGPARILAPYLPGGPADSGARGVFFSIQRDWNATAEDQRTPDGALKQLKRTVTVERPRFTDVLIARCTANSPQLAQEILAAYMDLAIKLHIEKYDDTRAHEEAQKAFDDAQQKHATARRQLREFLERKAHVDDFDMEKRRLQFDAAEGAVTVTKLEDDVTIKGKLLEELKKALEGPKALPQFVTEREKPSLNSEAITGRETQLLDLYRELWLLQQDRIDPNDPDITAKRREIDATNAAIRQMRDMARTAEPIEVSKPNPVYREAQDQRTKFETEMTTLGAQLSLAREQQDKRAARLRHLMELEPEYESLRSVVHLTEDSVRATRVNQEASQQKRALGLGRFSSLKRIEPATLPLDKEGPIRGRLLLSGVLVGLFLGLGIVVLRALPDTIVRSRDDLEQIEGLAVIGIMPRLDGTNLRRHVALRDQGW